MRAAVAARFGRAIVLCALAGLPPVAPADDVHCPLHLSEVKIDGNVLVAAPCQPNGTIVIGNVHLHAGGSLVMRGVTRIDGSIVRRSDSIYGWCRNAGVFGCRSSDHAHLRRFNRVGWTFPEVPRPSAWWNERR